MEALSPDTFISIPNRSQTTSPEPLKESLMTQFRYIPLAFALAAAGALSACATSPMTPMNKPVAGGVAAPHAMARMDEQMKTMLTMHDRMMKAKTPEERSKMMAEHMKAMQGGMEMMKGMGGDMGGMQGMHATAGDMATHHKMMAKHMEMMQAMMGMMHEHMMASMPPK